MVKNGKINKYGFIHISWEVFSELGLPRKQGIPIKIEVDAGNRTVICRVIKYRRQPAQKEKALS